MIHLRRLTKSFRHGGALRVICNDVTMSLPGGRAIGLLGRNGSGKSTLLQMIAGTERPSAGSIVADGSVSFPIGFSGAFHPTMSGAQNARFVARLYGADSDALADFAEDFCEIGPQFRLPLRDWSNGMRARLSLAVSLGLHFDTYLMDEVTAVGDAAFKRRSRALLAERLTRSGCIFVSHSLAQLQQICTSGLVLEAGRLIWFDEIGAAIEHHLAGLPRSGARLVTG